MSEDSLEEKALALIKSRPAGVLQSDLWKDLDIDSRKCSRVIAKLETDGKIKRTWETVKGTRTYRISYLPQKKEAPKKAVDFDLIMIEGKVAPCIGCTYECEPDYCPDLGNWIDLLARAPPEPAPMIKKAPAPEEVEEVEEEEVEEAVPVKLKKPLKAPVKVPEKAPVKAPVKPSKPVKEVKPAKVVKPVKEVKPAKVVKPVKEVKPAKVVKPVKGVKPAKVVKPVKAAKPAKAAKPVKVVKPVKPAKPAIKAKPAKSPARKIITGAKAAKPVKKTPAKPVIKSLKARSGKKK